MSEAFVFWLCKDGLLVQDYTGPLSEMVRELKKRYPESGVAPDISMVFTNDTNDTNVLGYITPRVTEEALRKAMNILTGKELKAMAVEAVNNGVLNQVLQESFDNRSFFVNLL